MDEALASALQTSFGDLDRLQEATGLVQRLLVFEVRLAIGNDAGTGLDVSGAAHDDNRSQRNASVHVAVIIKVPDRPGVRPARSIIRNPTSIEPVKAITETSG